MAAHQILEKQVRNRVLKKGKINETAKDVKLKEINLQNIQSPTQISE